MGCGRLHTQPHAWGVSASASFQTRLRGTGRRGGWSLLPAEGSISDCRDRSHSIRPLSTWWTCGRLRVWAVTNKASVDARHVALRCCSSCIRACRRGVGEPAWSVLSRAGPSPGAAARFHSPTGCVRARLALELLSGVNPPATRHPPITPTVGAQAPLNPDPGPTSCGIQRARSRLLRPPLPRMLCRS